MTRTGRDRGRRSAAAGAIALGLAACGAIAWDRGDGHIDATWTGAEKGKMSAAAAAIWCTAANTMRLTAVAGDTGIGILIHSADSLRPGRYPIVPPVDLRSKTPAASIGLRLVTLAAVSGYQSRSGTLILEQVEVARVSGRFDATARSATGAAGTISVSGRFSSVPLTAGGVACSQ